MSFSISKGRGGGPEAKCMLRRDAGGGGGSNCMFMESIILFHYIVKVFWSKIQAILFDLY